MLKKVLSSLLVIGVIAASVVAPVLAAAPYPDRPIPSDDQRGLFSDSKESFEPMQCELNLLSKTGLVYILFNADQSGGGLSFGRGHVVESVVIEVLLTELPGPIG